jgi:tRNA(fMet)-specific endonuclease VapC
VTIYLLDADTVLAGLRDTAATVRFRLDAAKAAGADIAVSAVTLLQLRHRITHGRNRFEERARLREFLGLGVAVLPFDADDAAMAGELQYALEAARTPIGPYDLLIAAQALRRGATLVAAAGTGLSHIPGVPAADWRI